MKAKNIQGIICLVIFTGLLCSYNISFADIYKYTDDEGIVHLTNIYGSEPCKSYGCKRILKEKPLNWEYFSDNYYYDKKNMTKLSNIISVWTYSFVTDDERKEIEKVTKKRDSDESLKYLLYNYESVLWELDCKNRMKKMKKIIYYDDKGNILDDYTKANSQWENISPDSVINKLYNKVCVTPKKPLKKK
jgi:hypothetical protein